MTDSAGILTTDERAIFAILAARCHPTHTLAQLATSAEMTRREAEIAVNGLRRSGVPILGDGRGVRLARSRDEALAAYRSLRRRALHQLVTAREAKRAALAMSERPEVYRVAESPELGL